MAPLPIRLPCCVQTPDPAPCSSANTKPDSSSRTTATVTHPSPSRRTTTARRPSAAIGPSQIGRPGTDRSPSGMTLAPNPAKGLLLRGPRSRPAEALQPEPYPNRVRGGSESSSLKPKSAHNLRRKCPCRRGTQRGSGQQTSQRTAHGPTPEAPTRGDDHPSPTLPKGGRGGFLPLSIPPGWVMGPIRDAPTSLFTPVEGGRGGTVGASGSGCPLGASVA